MSQYFMGTASFSSTGTKTITVGFQAKWLRITVSQKFATAQTFSHLSVGVSDGTNQVCDSTFYDGGSPTPGKTVRDSTKIVSHYERVAGTVTEKVAAHIDNSAAPWTATQIKFINDIADANYQYLIEAGD